MKLKTETIFVLRQIIDRVAQAGGPPIATTSSPICETGDGTSASC